MGFVLGTFALGCTALFLTQQMRNADRQPGHWMLMLGVASAMSNGIAISVVAAYISPESSYGVEELYLAHFMMFVYGPHSFWLTHQTVGWGLGTAAAICWFRKLRHRVMTPWRIVAALFVAAAAVIFCGNLVALFRMKFEVSNGPLIASTMVDSWLFWWLRWWCRYSGHVFAALVVVCSSAMLVAVVSDGSQRLRRDWLHWMGIGAWLVIAAMQLITFYILHFRPFFARLVGSEFFLIGLQSSGHRLQLRRFLRSSGHINR